MYLPEWQGSLYRRRDATSLPNPNISFQSLQHLIAEAVDGPRPLHARLVQCRQQEGCADAVTPALCIAGICRLPLDRKCPHEADAGVVLGAALPFVEHLAFDPNVCRKATSVRKSFT